MKNKRISIVIAAALATLFLFAGCGKATSTKMMMAETTAAGYEAEDADTMYAGRSNSSASLGARKAAGTNETWAEAKEDAGADVNNQTQSGTQNQTNVDPTKGRLLIRNVSMAAETKEFEAIRKSVEDKVRELGGYIENSGISGTGNSGSLRRANYTIRVPADKLDELISTVGENCTVTSTNESTTDVTLSYVDTKARLESLRVEQKQLTELLSQAKDLDSIIVLQNRLTEVRYQIESAESTLRVLENQVSYATLKLNIKEVLEVKPQEAPHVDTYGEKLAKTFMNSLKAIGEFFKGLLLVIVALSPVLVAMIIIAVIVLCIVFNARKKRRARAAALKAASAKPVDQAAPAQAKAEEKKAEKKEEKE
ncbi:MAG: DUF4349 domain-containing protein [Clostridiales bacterium]|nr:DUF4349 domain-containing protein [Clostridiales bacterium]